MCFILIAISSKPCFPCIIAANRDEYYDRSSQQLNYRTDKPQILGGRDLKQSGSWMALTKNGRFAAITNFRQGNSNISGKRSRGLLLTDFLDSDIDCKIFSEQLECHQHEYSGFNLIFGQLPDQLHYFSNRSNEKTTALKPGIYGLSNHLLDTPWPKLTHGKRKFKQVIQGGSSICDTEQALLKLLSDQTPADIPDLPATGVDLDIEQLLSSIFIDSPNYGTRCSSVIILDDSHQLRFTELTYNSHQRLKQNPVTYTLPLI